MTWPDVTAYGIGALICIAFIVERFHRDKDEK